ncbi:transposon Tf2-9 polyprotein [Trichonephila clavipes]|nr:transposon Tf2-9 polyprotein [Trichonephila clavipes]
MNYYNANNEDNINVKNNKGLDQVPDSPEADLKRLFNPAMVVEDTVPKQTKPQRIHLISDLPISLRPYKNSQQESKEIQTQIEELLKAGFIRPSHSPYAAPVTLAYKKDGGKRSKLCIDYRKLNEITRKDSTPVPLIDFVIDNLTHNKFFSTLDLTSGYWHIKIHEKDAEKLAFTTNFGLYECNPNIETIRKLATPKDVKELQRFLGSINVYQKFIKDYATLRVPLNKLLKEDAIWNWSHECQEAYQKLKNCLISKPILKLYNSQYPFHVFCDASQNSIGVVLKQQHPDGTLYPIAYHSRQLLKHEKNYTISEKECLAIIDALDKFYCYLHGSKFTIHTDHPAL